MSAIEALTVGMICMVGYEVTNYESKFWGLMTIAWLLFATVKGINEIFFN